MYIGYSIGPVSKLASPISSNFARSNHPVCSRARFGFILAVLYSSKTRKKENCFGTLSSSSAKQLVFGDICWTRPSRQNSGVQRRKPKKALKNFKRYVGIALIASSAFETYSWDRQITLVTCVIPRLRSRCNMPHRSDSWIINPSLRFEQTAYSSWRVGCTHSTFADRRYYDRSAVPWQCSTLRVISLVFGPLMELLIAQGVIIAVVLSGRSYQRMLAKKKVLTYFDMGPEEFAQGFYWK